jgi:hypothetical protein
VAIGAHKTCFQQVQDDMSKTHSVNKDWEFVSQGTEISMGKCVPEYFTPLTIDLKTGMVSTEDTETDLEKSFWINRSDGWVVNRKIKKIILLEFTPPI